MCALAGVLDYMSRTAETNSNGKSVIMKVCTLCGYKSRNVTNTQDHMLRKHAEPENIPCHLCGDIINYRPNLRKHLKACRQRQKFKPF